MSTAVTKFLCCSRHTQRGQLICVVCNGKYHFVCTHTNQSYDDLSEEYKRNWMCSHCADRSQTESSPSHDNPPESTPCNVTKKITRNISSPEFADVSQDKLISIVREELTSILAEFQSSICAKIDSKNEQLSKQIDEMATAMNFIEHQYEEIKNQFAIKSEIMAQLQSDNLQLKTTVSDLNSRLTLMEQHNRNTNVEIHCVPEHRSENLPSMIMQIAHVTKNKIEESDIHLCTRLAKLNASSTRPRSILVKFSSPRVRDGFLAAVISHNKKAKNNNTKLNTSHIGIAGNNQPIYVQEHLSPTTKALHAEARKKGKEKNYKFIWVKSGRIYMRKTEDSKYVVINSSKALDTLD